MPTKAEPAPSAPDIQMSASAIQRKAERREAEHKAGDEHGLQRDLRNDPGAHADDAEHQHRQRQAAR